MKDDGTCDKRLFPIFGRTAPRAAMLAAKAAEDGEAINTNPQPRFLTTPRTNAVAFLPSYNHESSSVDHCAAKDAASAGHPARLVPSLKMFRAAFKSLSSWRLHLGHLKIRCDSGRLSGSSYPHSQHVRDVPAGSTSMTVRPASSALARRNATNIPHAASVIPL